MTRSAHTWKTAAIAAAMSGVAHGAHAQPATAPAVPGTDFSSEVTVHRTIVNAQGEVLRELAGSRYRLERFPGGRTRLTMLPTKSTPTKGPMANPHDGTVVELDPATGVLTLLDKDGAAVPSRQRSPIAQTAPVGATTPERDAAGLVIPAADVNARRRDLAQAFGRRVGTVRALPRYLSTQGNAVQEVLISPDMAVPVEVNVVVNGTLEERHSYGYELRGAGQLVRTRTRSESRMPGSTDRLVSLTTMTDVRTTGGAR